MSAIRETIDAWEPVFRMGITDLFDGISHRLEGIVAGAFDHWSHQREVHRALTLGDRSAAKKALHGYTTAAVTAFGATEIGKAIATLSRRNRRRLERIRRRYGRRRLSRPSFHEGKEIAEILLSDPYAAKQYDPKHWAETNIKYYRQSLAISRRMERPGNTPGYCRVLQNQRLLLGRDLCH